MFEVGKKYYLTPYIDKIYECIWADGDKAVLRDPNKSWLHGGVSATNLANFKCYEEYKEPRTITRWVNIYERNDELNMGTPYITREKAINASDGIVDYKDTIPITYTEPH